MMIVYVPGTIYGYYWYKDQLIDVFEKQPLWQLPFVPDSPTASLFFTIALLWLWISPQRSARVGVNYFRGIIEALGVLTSVKYGVWATAVIIAGQAQGDVLVWEHWMLMIGHMAMAVVALFYARFFTFGGLALLTAAAWTFLNDTIDYTYEVFPYLPTQLYDDLTYVCIFTFFLTGVSLVSAALAKFAVNDKALDKPF